MIELPTKLGALDPFGRAEGSDQKQDYNDPAANLCAGTKPRFQFGAHRNTPITLPGYWGWKSGKNFARGHGVAPFSCIIGPQTKPIRRSVLKKLHAFLGGGAEQPWE